MNTPVLMTKDQFTTALKTAKPHSSIAYHVGSLMSDRQYGQSFLQIHAVAMAAWAAMEAGKVALVQDKLGSATRYVARVLPPPHKPVEWVGCYNPTRFSFKRVAA